MVLSRLPAIIALTALLLAGGATQAQQAATFAIRGYQVEGNTLLPQEQISLAVMPFTGDKANFETIQSALEALEKAYLKAGYGSVKIEVPEQDLQEGVVKLLVVEAKLEQIVVEGQKFHDEANILNSLPALQSGQVVNVIELQRNLDLANENFTKYTNVTFRRSESSGQTDAVVRVIDEDPLRFALSLDNSGTDSTGLYRLGLSVQNSNLFNLDHSLSAQIVTSPSQADKVAIVGLGYAVPLYRSGNSMDFVFGYSNVDSGQISLFSVSGSGLILGARYNQNLQPAGEWRQKIGYALNYRFYENNVVPLTGGASEIPNLQVLPISISYSANLQNAQRDVFASVALAHNLAFGVNGSTAAFNQPGGRAGANASFTTLNLAASFTERLTPDWWLRGALNGQYTNDLLISPEQFGAGGIDSVRGFSDRAIVGDRGARVGLELWGPDFGARGADTSLRVQPMAFLEGAWVRFNQAPGSSVAQSIASTGIGFRANYERSVSLRLFYGYVLRGTDVGAGATTLTPKGSSMVQGVAMWFF